MDLEYRVGAGPERPLAGRFVVGLAALLAALGSLAAGAGQPAPETVQVTFTAVEPGDRVVLPDGAFRGQVLVEFVAVDATEGQAGPGPPAEPRIASDSAGRLEITFPAGVPEDHSAVLRGSKGGQVTVTTGFTEPVIVSGGQADFVVPAGVGADPAVVAVAERPAEGMHLDWVASRIRVNGEVEHAVRVIGLPADACSDGAIDFQVEREGGTPRTVAVPALCLEYRMARAMHSGQTVALQARVEGADDDTLLEFSFVTDEALTVSRQSATLTVGRINAGDTLTEVTGNLAGGHVFNVTARLVRD